MVLISSAETHRPSTAALDNNHPQNNPHNHNQKPINNNHNQNHNHNSRGKSLSLSSFTSLPCFNINWGTQKHLRCVKDYDDNDHHHHHHELTRSEFDSGYSGCRKRRRSTDDGGIKAMREKLMLDFSRQAAQIQAAFLKKSDVVSTVHHSSIEVVESRPWNLRTRRAVCKDPNNNNNTHNNNINNNNNNGSLLSERKPSFLPTLMADVNGGEREKFSRSLSKQEIEEDFLEIMGIRPVRRPKKRPRIIQRQIDAITPGFWLSEITADMYKVNEQV